MSRRWLKTLGKIMLWGIVYTLVLLYVAEKFLAYRGFTPEQPDYIGNSAFDSLLGMVTQPGYHYPVTVGNAVPWKSVNVWPDGSRRSRSKREKRASRRVLLLGCSHTYGLGIGDDDTFAWQLNERFPDVVFDNFGVNGYGTYNCYLREKQQLLMYPHYDLVLYCAFLDHINRNEDWVVFTHFEDPRELLWIRPRVDYDNRGCMLYYSPVRHWPGDNLFISVNFAKRTYYHNLVEKSRSSYGVLDAKKYSIFWELNQRMAKEAHRYGAQYGLVWLFDPEDWGRMTAERHKLYENYPWDKRNIRWTRDPEYPCLCLGNSAELREKNHLSGDVGHFTKPVHSFWAQGIGDWLEEWWIKGK